MCITFIGSLVIIIKKVASRQIIQRIPKSNILPQLTNYQQQSFQTATLHGNNQQPTALFNNSKHNKNIGTLNWIFIVGVIFYVLMFVYRISTPLGWITVSQSTMYGFVHCCCVPVLLPTIYFMRNPKHFISVLQDHNLM